MGSALVLSHLTAGAEEGFIEDGTASQRQCPGAAVHLCSAPPGHFVLTDVTRDALDIRDPSQICEWGESHDGKEMVDTGITPS